MKTKVVNIKHEPYDVYIGRGSPFGNKWSHINSQYTIATYIVNNIDEALYNYNKWFYNKLDTDINFGNLVLSLYGKRLGCFCRPKNGFNGQLLCHGQIIAGFLEDINPTKIP